MREAAGARNRLRHLGRGEHRAERRVAGGQPLRQHGDVGHDAPMLAGEEAAGAAGAAHHLVMDQQHTVTRADLADAPVVAGGRDQRAGREAAHRLQDEGEHAFRRPRAGSSVSSASAQAAAQVSAVWFSGTR